MSSAPNASSDEGAFSFVPGMPRDKLRRALQAREFVVARDMRTTRRDPSEWTGSLLYSAHREIFGSHFPQLAGRNRTGEANFGSRAAPAPERIDGLMSQLIASMQAHLETIRATSDESSRLELIFNAAAQDHAEMIRIHPFVDGNGRWARILTNAFLYDCGLKAGVVFKLSRKPNYISALDRWIDLQAPGELATELLLAYAAQLRLRRTPKSGVV